MVGRMPGFLAETYAPRDARHRRAPRAAPAMIVSATLALPAPRAGRHPDKQVMTGRARSS